MDMHMRSMGRHLIIDVAMDGSKALALGEQLALQPAKRRLHDTERVHRSDRLAARLTRLDLLAHPHLERG